MENEIAITLEGTYIEVHSNGDKNLKHATRLWTEIVYACNKHNCFNVLGLANTTNPVNTIEAVDHVELFQKLDITKKYRIAWVELNKEATEMPFLIENLLSARGVNVHLFANKSDAKQWLFMGYAE